MSINIEKIIRLNELVNMFFRSKHTIVLDPKIREKKYGKYLGEDMVYDKLIGIYQVNLKNMSIN